MKPFTFVHAADLHIGSPFKGVSASSASLAAALRDATLQAFQNIVALCIDRKVDFLVVAGDIYDGADRSIAAQLAFLDGLTELAKHGIRTFVAYGNHDPLDGWASSIDWPEQVKIFGNRVESELFLKDGEPVANIAGISYQTGSESRNLARLFAGCLDSRHPGLYSLAILHCNVAGESAHANYAPCSLSDLQDCGFDYWALGHVHERKVLYRKPYVVYPGNAQGRNIRESGARGCYLVSVQADCTADLDFVATDKIRFGRGKVAIDGMNSLSELDRALAKEMEKLRADSEGRPVLCRIELSGRGQLYHEISQDDELEDLLERCRQKCEHERPFCWVEELELSCRPEMNLAEARKRDDLLGSVLREADEMRQSNLEGEISAMLKSLYGHAGAKVALSRPEKEEWQRLLEEAEMLCVDLLESG